MKPHIAPVYNELRLTVPAREALEHGGNTIEAETAGRFAVTLCGTVPTGIVECLIGHGLEQHRGLRLDVEPAYPGEWANGAVAWYEHGQWVPCPTCGCALVWYEAGYVPGHRVCTAGHHAQLSGDGRSAVESR